MAQAVKINSIKHLNHDVLEITLEKPEEISYKPGQAADVAINKSGWKDEWRPFTFVSLEEDPYIRFNTKTYTDHDGVTNQLLSLKEGDELLIGEVFGAIHYEGEGMFLAGGAGITPFLAIFNKLKRDHKVGNNRLLFGNKETRDIFHREELNKLFGRNFINVLSNDDQAEGEHGFIDADLIKKYSSDQIDFFYVCGPDPMMDAVSKALKKLSVPKSKIITEDFS